MRHHAEANLSALIESTEDLIWSVDLDYRLITFNQALRRDIQNNYGVGVAEGMRFHEFLAPGRAALWPPFYERALSQGPFRTEYSLLDGRTLELAFNPIVAGGKQTGISVFGKDVTEFKRSDAALRESLESLREAQVMGALGSYVLDFRAGTWTSSDVLDEIFGIDGNYERTVAGWTALISPDDRAMMAAYLAEKVIGMRQSFEKEYRIVRQTDRAERWVYGIGRLEFDAEGQHLRMRGVIKDITDSKQSEMQLRESEERYRATFEQAAVGIVHVSMEGRYLRCNARFAEIIGYPREEVIGLSFHQITAPADLELSRTIHRQLLESGSPVPSSEKRYVRKDGSLVWVLVTLSPQRDVQGRVLYHSAIVEEIQERKIAEERLAAAAEALRLSEERYRIAFQTSLDAININRLDDGRYIDSNPAFSNILGYTREEVLGRTSLEMGIWADPRDRQTMAEMVQRNSICHGLEAQFRKKNGEIIWGEMSAALMEVEGVACILSITRDLSTAKEAENTIRSLAFYDPLTGLPNRRQLMDRLRQIHSGSVREGRLQALLQIDLNHFKILNDTLGHPTGDLILKEVGQRIAASVYENDTVCRLGGDEFVVMIEDLSEVAEQAAAQAKAVGEHVLAAIDRPFLIEGREHLLTASIGITVFGERKNSSDDVLQQADIALNQAKAAGRNTMRFFSPALQSAVNARADLEQDLRGAIKANQFLLYYQAQVERNHVTGAEALIRWNHPRRGLVPPDEFIPLAEESRLILPLGDWVLETACAQISSWAGQAHTAHLTVAVNISALQFRQQEFVDHVLSALDRTGANPRNLRLELTESILVENLDEVIAKMAELKLHGLRFSLDDFGTGYSSLAYLKRLPLDELKIDRVFVRDMLVDETSGAIAQTILSLGRAMDLSVIAEGVETEQQRGFLAGLGCHSFQGFLFSRPLPLKQFEAFLRIFSEGRGPR